MVEPNYNTVIDISSIIWDENDYENNTEKYFDLIVGVSDFLEKVKNENLKVLGRDELLSQMVDGFPFDNLPDRFYEFGNIVYSFLANIGSNFISYPDTITNNLKSDPELVKTHYNDIVKPEINYLISKIHSDDETESKYFTFNYLWNGNDKLKTETEDKKITYETIIADNGNDLDDFFAKYKPTFDHNPKHDKKSNNTKEKWLSFADKDAFNSRLSCYNGSDNVCPQKILDDKYPNQIGEEYIGYDGVNEVYVRFKCHKDNLYHGFDEYDIDNIEKIPLKVREHFNK